MEKVTSLVSVKKKLKEKFLIGEGVKIKRRKRGRGGNSLQKA